MKKHHLGESNQSKLATVSAPNSNFSAYLKSFAQSADNQSLPHNGDVPAESSDPNLEP